MAWVNTFDTTTPDGATQPVSILDNSIQTLKKAIQERLNIDLMFALDGTQVSDTDAGKHRKVTFYGVLAVKPTLEALECAIYTKTVSGKSELFFENEDGTEKQLTTAGQLNIAAADIGADAVNETHIELQNNSPMVSKNLADNGDVDLIYAGIDDKPTLPDTARLATSAAPTEDEEIANKKYVDDNTSCQGDGTVVFNTSMAAGLTWQDLDLSAYVGANFAMVFIEVTASAVGYFVIKPKGYGSANTVYHGTDGNTNGVGACPLSSTKVRYVMSFTDASGVVQIAANGGTVTITLTLIGFNN